MDFLNIIKDTRKEYDLQQIDEEWIEFLTTINSINPSLIVEIGGHRGGSAACFAKLAKTVITIDIWQGRINVEKLKQNCNYHLISDNSHNQECKDKLKQLLGGKKIDVLFIDGDHTSKGATEDFYYYKNFVRAGGIIGLHDIKESDYHKKQFCNVHNLWNKLQKEFKNTIEIKRGTPDWGGIGIVKL